MSGDQLKVVGFHLGCKPTLDVNVRQHRRKFGSKSWCLGQLKRVGMAENKLLQVYTKYFSDPSWNTLHRPFATP